MTDKEDTYIYKGTLVSQYRLLTILGVNAYLEYVKHWSDWYDIYEIIKESSDGVHSEYLYGLVWHGYKKAKTGNVDTLSSGIYTLSKLRNELESMGG